MSVFLILTLVTTISFNASLAVFAEGEEGDNTTAGATETTETTETAEQGAGTPEVPASQEQETEQPEGQTLEELIQEDTESSDPLDTGLRRQTKKPKVTAGSYIVMSGSTSEIVLDRHAERKLSPGCITMLMTAMVAIDNMYNDSELNNTVEITKRLAKYGNDFKVGESVSVGGLMDAMIVGGSVQAAEALARYSASKRKIFISEMNSKSMELGLMDTQFTNPGGEYDAQHYSTAHDCAIITQAATRYQLIKNAFAKRNASVKVTSKSGDRNVTFTNTNPLMTGSKPSELYNLTRGGLLGTIYEPIYKCQYTGIATSDDMQLIVILLDADSGKLAYEAKALLEYADSKVTRSVIVKANKRVGRVRVKGGNHTFVSAYTETKGFAYVPPEGSTELVRTETVMYDDIKAPLKEGSKVGEYRIYVADELKGTVDLVTRKNITKGWWPSQYYISNIATIIIGVILFIILIFILRIMYVRKRRARIRAERRARRLHELAMQQLAAEEDRRMRNWENRTAPVIDDKTALRTGDLREQAKRETMREQLIAEAAKTGISAKTLSKMAKNEKKKDTIREKTQH